VRDGSNPGATIVGKNGGVNEAERQITIAIE